jgi:hypothetical protein
VTGVSWHHVGVKSARKTAPKVSSRTKQPAAKQPAAKQPAAKQPAAKQPAAKQPAAKQAATRSATSKPAPRADYGKPIDGFFARQPAALRAILEELRALIEEAAPDASSSLKWGMPFYTMGDTMMCALAGHKSHVNLILSGPPGTYADPEGLLTGDGKTGRHLKLTSLDQLPHNAVRGWLRTAAELARKQ